MERNAGKSQKKSIISPNLHINLVYIVHGILEIIKQIEINRCNDYIYQKIISKCFNIKDMDKIYLPNVLF